MVSRLQAPGYFPASLDCLDDWWWLGLVRVSPVCTAEREKMKHTAVLVSYLLVQLSQGSPLTKGNDEMLPPNNEDFTRQAALEEGLPARSPSPTEARPTSPA